MKQSIIAIFIIICLAGGYFAISAKSAKLDLTKVEQAESFCKKNGYNTDYCFFVDFSQSTQVKRFYVYDFNKKKIVFTCYCAHGNDGTGNTNQQADINSFSNKIGSHRSSLGKYRIGKRRTINSVDGMFDVSMYNIPCYEVHGLDKTNNNAHKRGILIHPMPTMDSNWLIIPPGVSLGCFSVGFKAFDKLSEYIDNSTKPVLLWAYFNN